jgi:NTE family protein
MSEFHRASEAIDRGYIETKSKIAEIRRMQDSLVAR